MAVGAPEASPLFASASPEGGGVKQAKKDPGPHGRPEGTDAYQGETTLGLGGQKRPGPPPAAAAGAIMMPARASPIMREPMMPS